MSLRVVIDRSFGDNLYFQRVGFLRIVQPILYGCLHYRQRSRLGSESALYFKWNLEGSLKVSRPFLVPSMCHKIGLDIALLNAVFQIQCDSLFKSCF